MTILNRRATEIRLTVKYSFHTFFLSPLLINSIIILTFLDSILNLNVCILSGVLLVNLKVIINHETMGEKEKF